MATTAAVGLAWGGGGATRAADYCRKQGTWTCRCTLPGQYTGIPAKRGGGGGGDKCQYTGIPGGDKLPIYRDTGTKAVNAGAPQGGLGEEGGRGSEGGGGGGVRPVTRKLGRECMGKGARETGRRGKGGRGEG